MIYIYYDNDCDGFCSAWLVVRWLSSLGRYLGTDFKLHPVKEKPWKVDIEDHPRDTSFFILDLSISPETIERIRIKYAGFDGLKKLYLFDHHKTAFNMLASYIGKYDDDVLVDISNDELAACEVTSRNISALNPGDWKEPWLVKYVADMDLWRFELPDSRAVCAAIVAVPKEIEAWNELAEEDKEVVAFRGSVMLDERRSQVSAILENAHRIVLPDSNHVVHAVNSPILRSELGEALLTLYPESKFVAIYFTQSDGNTHVSLRTRAKFGELRPEVDVSDVASSYGGGGHAFAAAFTVTGGLKALPLK